MEDPMTQYFYHATDVAFDRFDPSRLGSKGATNGHLGVWVGNEKSECEMFGDVLMTVSVGDVVAYPMKYRELRGLHDQTLEMSDDEAAEFYREIADNLMAAGYNVIDIHELRGVVHSILLDLDSIVIESQEIQERKEPSTWGRS
jgi:hypothetical protein